MGYLSATRVTWFSCSRLVCADKIRFVRTGGLVDSWIPARLDRSAGSATKTFTMLALMVILSAGGNALLSVGMRQAAPPTMLGATTLADMAARAVGVGALWLGLLCLVGYVIAEMVILSWADYSYVQPATAASYALVALVGYWILGEDISPTRWLGVAIICVGVWVVGQTSPHTSRLPRHE